MIGLCATTAGLAVACVEIVACPGVTVGDHVDLELYEGFVSPPQSIEDALACAEEWGFSEGTTFRAAITETRGEYDCRAGVLEIEQVDGWTYEPLPLRNFKGLGVVLVGRHAVVKGECHGEIGLDLHTSRQRLDCDAQGTAGDECRLEISLIPGNGSEDTCPPVAACTSTLARSARSERGGPSPWQRQAYSGLQFR